MTKFIMVRYDNKKYPQEINCAIDEIPGHFDINSVNQNSRYLLHTDNSFKKKKFDNELLKDLDEIKLSTKDDIPQLWKNEKWAKEFFQFIERLLCESIDPEIIEIHPPFIDYCSAIDDFLNIYETFENLILNRYNNVKIFIENRFGTQYRTGSRQSIGRGRNLIEKRYRPRHGKKFLISNCNDIISLCNKLSERDLKLKIVLDYPQLMNSEHINSNNPSIKSIIDFNANLKDQSEYIGGIHLWGRKVRTKGQRSHYGNLNTLFNNNYRTKKLFLQSLHDTFDDDIIRYMVLEVNSSTKDMHAIIKDLMKYEFEFV